jgi:hypothetical protein
MASKRSRSNPKTRSMTSAPARVRRFDLFGPPPLLEGEDAALYDDLVGRMWAAVNPVDVIDELHAADVVSLEWEVMRWRRLKFSLLQASVHNVLEGFLNEQLDYEAYAEAFAEALAEILQEVIPNDLAEEEAKKLAHQCARSQPDAVKKVTVLLKAAGLQVDEILDHVKAQRAKELVQEYARRESGAMKVVDELLASGDRTMHDLMLQALSENLNETERIDRLITIAETRRNVSLREIDRRRAVLGEALRRNLQEVEEGEFEVIEPTPVEGSGVTAGSPAIADCDGPNEHRFENGDSSHRGESG